MKKKNILFVAILCVFSTFTYSLDKNSPMLGQTIQFLSGDTTTLAKLLDSKPVYLKFWATWCQPCRKEMPHLQHTFEKYGDDVHVVSVNIDMNDNLAAVEATVKEFGLTMPIAMDSSGELAHAFNLTGTPFHLLLTKQGRLVHKGHEATKELDNRIALLASSPDKDLAEVSIDSTRQNKSLMGLINKDHALLYFTATWCDWYLQDSRPAMSKHCTKAQETMNTLVKTFPNHNWVGVASRLWTTENDLKAYLDKYSVLYDFEIDTSNETFLKHKVKSIPTLLVLENADETYRLTDFDNLNKLTSILESMRPRILSNTK